VDFEQYRQATIDADRLEWLPMMYWVSGGVGVLFSLYFLIYVVMGVTIAAIPTTSDESAPPAIIGWMIAGMGLVGFVLIALLGVLRIMSGFWIRARKHRVAIMVIAGISCLEIPYGTLMGVVTFMILGRKSVAELFNGSPAGVPPHSAPPPPPQAADSFEGWDRAQS
jgi:uncharacterized integral membrane protein